MIRMNGFLPRLPEKKAKMSKLAVGTAQFGLSYGIANQSGQVNLTEAKIILEQASKANINMLDTAIAYGVSEETLGKIGVKEFNIISKLPAVPESCSNVDS